MKSKRFLIRLFGILSLIFIVFIYLILYCLPSLKTINKTKRNLKDLDLKIEDFKRMENLLSLSDETEKKLWFKADQEFKSRITEIKSNGDFKKLVSDVYTSIKNLARTNGILNLTITPKASEMETKTTNIKTGTNRIGQIDSILNKLNKLSIVLRFTGDLKTAMNFINHIPWTVYCLTMDTLTISDGDLHPYYMAVLNIQYLDQKQKSGYGLLVDFDSEILLKKVYNNFPERYRKKELSTHFGENIFLKEKK